MDRRAWIGLALVAVVVAALASTRAFVGETRDVTTSSDEAYAAYEEGEAALGRFRMTEADAALARAVELDPNFAMAYVRRAQTALSFNDREAAKSYIQAAYDAREGTTELEQLWIERTHAAINGEREKSDALYEQLVERYGDHPWVLRLRAEFDKLNGDFESALDAYERILELDPEAVDVHNLQGYIYLSMGEYEKAVQSLQRYAFYAPDQANPHDSLGEAFLYTGRYEEAIREFVRALEIDPGFVWSAVHLSDALGVIGQFEKAREVLDRVEPLFVERNWVEWMAVQRMRIDHRAERWEEVLRAAEERLASRDAAAEPDEFSLWLQYSRVLSHLELGDLEAAERVLPELQAAASSFLEERGQYATVNDIARLNEALIRARFGRAEGNPASGIDALEQAIEESHLSPHELSSFRYELASDLVAAGRAQEAIEITDEHLAVIPTSPAMNLMAARAYAELGERERALEHLQVFLEVMRSADEGHPRVAEATRMLQILVPRS